MRFNFWVQSKLQSDALIWQQRLNDAGVVSDLQVVDSMNARHLRLHPQMSLIYDQQGLSLAANGMKMQPDWVGQLLRLRRAGKKNEMIARACNVERQPRIIDATAGLGHDGLLLAWLGADLYMVERHPILFTLLQSSYQQAAEHPDFADTLSRIHLVHADAATYLAQQPDRQVDVVYLDPMFPKPAQADKKQAQVKKEMQILHQLLMDNGIIDLGENLLPLAKKIARRVVVKRPRHAVTLTGDEPQHQWLGDACRFDAYFQVPLS